jgi:hypothetical protein
LSVSFVRFRAASGGMRQNVLATFFLVAWGLERPSLRVHAVSPCL